MISPITYPLYFFALYSLPLAVVLIFVSRRAFGSWLKFAAWALPLLAILVATQPVVASFLSTNRDDAARLAAQIFSITSLGVIVFSALFSRLKGGESARAVSEWKALAAASVGFLSISAFFLMGLLNVPLSFFGLFLFIGAVSIVANLYALYQAVVFWRESRRERVALERGLAPTAILLGLSCVGYGIFWYLVYA